GVGAEIPGCAAGQEASGNECSETSTDHGQPLCQVMCGKHSNAANSMPCRAGDVLGAASIPWRPRFRFRDFSIAAMRPVPPALCGPASAKSWPREGGSLTHHQFKEARKNRGQRKADHPKLGCRQQVAKLIEVVAPVKEKFDVIRDTTEPKQP